MTDDIRELPPPDDPDFQKFAKLMGMVDEAERLAQIARLLGVPRQYIMEPPRRHKTYGVRL